MYGIDLIYKAFMCLILLNYFFFNSLMLLNRDYIHTYKHDYNTRHKNSINLFKENCLKFLGLRSCINTAFVLCKLLNIDFNRFSNPYSFKIFLARSMCFLLWFQII